MLENLDERRVVGMTQIAVKAMQFEQHLLDLRIRPESLCPIIWLLEDFLRIGTSLSSSSTFSLSTSISSPSSAAKMNSPVWVNMVNKFE